MGAGFSSATIAFPPRRLRFSATIVLLGADFASWRRLLSFDEASSTVSL
jgi:hypothetical protein